MNKELLHLLVCPRCRGELQLITENNEEKGLACAACAVLYPLRDQIPVMLVEEALPFSAPKENGGSKEGGACACS